MDPSAAHSYGWELQDNLGGDDPRTIPNHNQPPPTKEECKTFKTSLDRIVQFYGEGASKQDFQLKQIRDERDYFESGLKRINAQLTDLQKFPADHTRRMALEKELESETQLVKREIGARVRAEEKLKVLYQKRGEIVDTMTYMNKLLESHCGTLLKD